ncbi:MAG TPA: Ig-like domain-containing protein [Longimicrobium sp.]|nr:Ig-like domain-containing protein [Longimicrobium sp.]
MRKLLLCSALALLAAGCKDGGSTPSVATSVTLTPGTVSLNAIGATQVVHATVADQKGKAMNGAAVNWSSSSAAVTVAGAGGDSAIVTAVGNGSASITAASGSASGAAAVQVVQVATTVQKAGGDAQTGAVASALAQPLTVGARDRLGAPVAGVTVNFVVTGGGGTLSAASATTGANGNVTVVWTLGTAAGSLQRVVATASVGNVEFNATAVAGAPVTATIAAGNNQTALRSAAVATAPRVLVRDAFNNPVPGVAVQFSVSAGGGSITGPTQTTDANGSAAVTSWTLGAASGANSLTVTFPGTAVPPIVFNATAASAGTVALHAGDNQAAMVGAAVPSVPRVIVRDGLGSPLAGMEVTFAVTAGGGTIGTTTATTDASGVASVESWTMGSAGPNALRASVAGITAAPVVFRGTGCQGGGGTGYAMTLCFTSTMTATQRAAFTTAAARWASVVTGDLPDIAGGIPEGSCGDDSPSMDQNFDDLVIFAAIEEIDGPGSILGSAGWCYRRTGGLPLMGLMRFDEADMNGLEANGSLNAVILHEMGHVMGIGTLWSQLGLLKNPSSGANAVDTYFSGVNGIAGFDAIGGTGYTGGQKVPVENTGGPGTANSHWRETVLVRELMTGYLNSGSNPLSVLTVRSLMDMGYTVNVAAADAYSLTVSLQGAPGWKLDLGNDIWTGPRYTIDRQGRRTRIR